MRWCVTRLGRAIERRARHATTAWPAAAPPAKATATLPCAAIPCAIGWPEIVPAATQERADQPAGELAANPAELAEIAQSLATGVAAIIADRLPGS